MDEVVEKLRRKQDELGIGTQAEFAAFLGISQSQLSRVYSGERNPSGRLVLMMISMWPDMFISVGGDDGYGSRILGVWRRVIETSGSLRWK